MVYPRSQTKVVAHFSIDFQFSLDVTSEWDLGSTSYDDNMV